MTLAELHAKKAKGVKIKYISWPKDCKEYRIFNYINKDTFSLTFDNGFSATYNSNFEPSDSGWYCVNSYVIKERLGIR